jgi:hypothetical protein
MPSPELIKFDDSHRNDFALVREVFIRRLREDAHWNQFGQTQPEFSRYLEFPSYADRTRFDELLRQVIWEFISAGIIAPGNGLHTGGANLPFFTITDYGHQVLAAERAIPHDPEGYLHEVREAGSTCVDAVAVGYIEEALRCFTRGCYTASVLLLGVAAEAVVLKVFDLIASGADASQKKKLERLRNIKDKHRWLIDRYEALPPKLRREALPDGIDVTLASAYDLIRRQRNELGHPQQVPPDVNREHAFVFFQCFLTIVRDLEAFATLGNAT